MQRLLKLVQLYLVVGVSIISLMTALPAAALGTNSAQLNGTNQYYSLPGTTAALRITGAMTMCAKFKPATWNSFDARALIFKGNDATAANYDYAFIISTNASNETLYRFARGRGTNVDDIIYNPGSTRVAANAWRYLCAVYDGGTVVKYYDATVYANFQQVGGDQTITAGTTNDSTVSIFSLGSTNGGSRFLKDFEADVWIWDDAETSAALKDFLCTPPTSATPHIKGIWSLDNTETDASGNGNTLTNVNTVTYAADVMNPSCPAPAVVDYDTDGWFMASE